jgi:hypothetical protein
MKVFSLSEASRQLSVVLNLAQSEGEVRVSMRDGRMFSIRPVQSKKSPLDISGVDSNLTTQDILISIHESRRQL